MASYAYDPWGRPTGVGGSDAALAASQPLRYRAYYPDAESGLYYLPARYYDPATARFVSVDPAPPSAGDPQSLNGYAYCQDDPIGASDPSGATMTDYYYRPHSYAGIDYSEDMMWLHHYQHASSDAQRRAAAAREAQRHARQLRLVAYRRALAAEAARRRAYAAAFDASSRARLDAANDLSDTRVRQYSAEVAGAVFATSGLIVSLTPIGAPVGAVLLIAGTAACAAGMYQAHKRSHLDAVYASDGYATDMAVGYLGLVMTGLGSGASVAAGRAAGPVAARVFGVYSGIIDVGLTVPLLGD